MSNNETSTRNQETVETRDSLETLSARLGDIDRTLGELRSRRSVIESKGGSLSGKETLIDELLAERENLQKKIQLETAQFSAASERLLERANILSTDLDRTFVVWLSILPRESDRVI